MITIEMVNIYPNKKWFLETIDVLGTITCNLYATQADMESQINVVATGVADADGYVILDQDEYDADVEEIRTFYDGIDYHFQISGNGSTNLQISPFSDLDEIRHPIYYNPLLPRYRGEAELNIHTYSIIRRSLTLATHIPTLDVGDIAQIVSVRRGETSTHQVLEVNIQATVDDGGGRSLISSVAVANYTEITRRR